LLDDKGDFYQHYSALYCLWCSNNAAVGELRPLFRIPGADPGGALSIAESFKNDVRKLAKEILPLISDSKVREQ
jgi:hypothetical protein